MLFLLAGTSGFLIVFLDTVRRLVLSVWNQRAGSTLVAILCGA